MAALTCVHCLLGTCLHWGGVWVAGPGREMEEQAGLVTGEQEVLGTLKHSRLGWLWHTVSGIWSHVQWSRQ